MKRRDNALLLVVGLVIMVFLSGCNAHQEPKWSKNKNKDSAIYTIASRQLPLPPTYNPVRWVRPPEVLPSRNVNKHSSAPLIKSIISFSVKDVTLEETSQIFANALGYRSYCSSLIAKRMFALETIGTIDEIAAAIEKNAGIKVAIDHDTKDVRFLAGKAVAPQFAERR